MEVIPKLKISVKYLFPKVLPITILIFLLISCNQSKNNINDRSRRNANWEWWVDSKTGKGEWIALGEDSSTLKNGSYTTFYYNGEKCEEGKLSNGKKVDTLFAYNLKGEPDFYQIADLDTTIYFYQFGGYRKVYYREGKLLAESQIKNHKYYGILINYYKNGNRKFVRNYVKDSGWNVQYYENGQQKDSAVEFNNSGKGRICKSYFENGQIKSIVNWNFKTGLQEGNTKMFYESDNKLNSNIKSSVDWKNGLWDGITLLYYANGIMSDSMNFIQGKHEGIAKSWDENGKLYLINSYRHDSLLNSQNLNVK